MQPEANAPVNTSAADQVLKIVRNWAKTRGVHAGRSPHSIFGDGGK